MRVIFHIDLNAFFVSAEISKNPLLNNQPVVISRDSRRAVVSTASYEARKYGIHSAMPLYQAKEKCKNLIIVSPHFDLYRSLSNQFFDIIRSYTRMIQIASIDECYADFSEMITETHMQPYALAYKIQQEILNKLNLPCSIGISPNKFLSKMASDMKKPLGITIITKSNIKEILWPLSVNEMYGIGKKTAPKLIENNIKTIGDVANYSNYTVLRTILGRKALIYYQRANGKDDSKIEYDESNAKSISHSMTFERDLDSLEEIEEAYKNIVLALSERAKQYNLVSNHIGITLKSDYMHSLTRQMVINHYTNDYEDIYNYAIILLRRNYSNQQIRLIGIGMNDTLNIKDVKVQMSIFDMTSSKKKGEDINTFIEELNENNSLHLMKASDLLNKG